MSKIVAALVLLGLGVFTCQAIVLPEDSPVIDPLSDVDYNNIDSSEAVQVGQILRSVARDLFNKEERDNGTDEYFIKELWKIIVEAAKRALKKMTKAVGEAVNEAAGSIKEATGEAKQQAKERALEILKKIVGDNAAQYAGDEFDNKADFVRGLCARIDEVGKRLIETGSNTK